MRGHSRLSNLSKGISPFNDFIRRTPTRHGANAIFVNEGTYKNLAPAGIVVDPLDDTKFLFFMAEFLGFSTIDCRIGYHIGDLSDPYDLGARQGTALVAGGSGQFDEEGARFGCVIMKDGLINMFYVGIDASFKWRIGLATSATGRAGTWTKLGVVVDYNDTDEKSVSDPAVILDDDGKYKMIYSVWDGTADPFNNPGKSTKMKSAESTGDLTSWTKHGVDILSLGAGGTYDDSNIEGGQFFKAGNKYVILYNANPGSSWDIALAYTEIFPAVFHKVGLYFEDSVGPAWDDGIVAVPLIYTFPDGSQVMYYQASIAVNPDEELDIGAADLLIP